MGEGWGGQQPLECMNQYIMDELASTGRDTPRHTLVYSPADALWDVLLVAVKARRSPSEGVLCPGQRSCYEIILSTRSRGNKQEEVRGEIHRPGRDEWGRL